MDYHQMTSPCGLDCFNCPMHLATEDVGMRAIWAEKTNLPLEKVRCAGCRNERGSLPFRADSEPCGVYSCTSRQGIEFCHECADFPCDNFHPYSEQSSVRQHNTKLFNSCLIKKIGLKTWATEKAKSVRETYFNGRIRTRWTDKGSAADDCS
jgi:hypothetical protein